MSKSKLTVTILTKRGAERFTRISRNIPEHVGLGWTPYRYLVMKDATSHTAFVRAKDFKRWLSAHGYRFVLSGRSAAIGPNSWSVALGTVEAQ